MCWRLFSIFGLKRPNLAQPALLQLVYEHVLSEGRFFSIFDLKRPDLAQQGSGFHVLLHLYVHLRAPTEGVCFIAYCASMAGFWGERAGPQRLYKGGGEGCVPAAHP